MHVRESVCVSAHDLLCVRTFLSSTASSKGSSGAGSNTPLIFTTPSPLLGLTGLPELLPEDLCCVSNSSGAGAATMGMEKMWSGGGGIFTSEPLSLLLAVVSFFNFLCLSLFFRCGRGEGIEGTALVEDLVFDLEELTCLLVGKDEGGATWLTTVRLLSSSSPDELVNCEN